METTIKDRIKQIIAYKNTSINSFENSISVSTGFVNNVKLSIGLDKIQRILSTYPEIDINWLVLGEGEMLRKEVQVQDACDSYSVTEALPNSSQQADIIQLLLQKNQIIMEKDSRLEEKQQRIDRLTDEVIDLNKRLAQAQAENKMLKVLLEKDDTGFSSRKAE